MTSPFRSKLGIAAAVFVVTAAVFASARSFGFIRLDDAFYVFQNKHIAGGLDARAVRWALTDVGYAENWHPLTWVSHAADVSVCRRFGWPLEMYGRAAKFMHAENVMWHAANAVLLYLVILALMGADGGRRFHRNRPTGAVVVAAGCALLWAVHPLRCEVVCWVSERKELVSVCFMLMTMILYCGAPRTSRPTGRILSLFTFTFSLLAKPVAVSLPAVLFAYDWVIARRPFGRAFLRTLPFVLLSAGASALTLLAQDYAIRVGAQIDWWTRLTLAVEAPVVYLRQTFWPFGLSLSYPLPAGFSVETALGILLLAAMPAACVWFLVRANAVNRILVFSVAWLYVGLVPMLGLVKVGAEPHSDRYTYWVGCGLAAVAALAARETARWWRPRAAQAGRVGLGLIAALGFLAFVRTQFWRDSATIFADAVATAHTENLSFLLADEYSHRGPEGEARGEEVLRDVLSVKHTGRARANLALYLAQKQKLPPVLKTFGSDGPASAFDEARLLAGYVLEDNTGGGEAALAALAWADMRDGRYEEAVKEMEEALANGYEEQRYLFDIEDWRKKRDEKKRED